MDQLGQIVAMHSDRSDGPSPSERACPECTERSYLRELVAELLYKNQILRLDLQSAQGQLMKSALPPVIGDE
jgi:hypothetical protein